jgi:hypothetical protein
VLWGIIGDQHLGMRYSGACGSRDIACPIHDSYHSKVLVLASNAHSKHMHLGMRHRDLVMFVGLGAFPISSMIASCLRCQFYLQMHILDTCGFFECN